MYHRLLLPSIAARFKFDVSLSSVDDAVVVTQEAFGDDRQESSFGGVFVSDPPGTGDHEGDWDIRDTLSGLSIGREKYHVVL